MKKRPKKKAFEFPKPWKPIPLPPAPVLPQLPPMSPKPVPSKGDHRREVFEPILSRPIELEEIVIRFQDIDGKHEIKSCYGDIRKIVDVFMDYARLLELVNDEWNLDPYRRAVNEITAEKLRAIAKKYQEAIGYDYDAALAKCEAKRKKQRKDDDIGGDALELAMRRGKK